MSVVYYFLTRVHKVQVHYIGIRVSFGTRSSLGLLNTVDRQVNKPGPVLDLKQQKIPTNYEGQTT